MAVECSILVEILKNVHLGTYIKVVMSCSAGGGGWGVGMGWRGVPAWWPDLPLAGYESSLFYELSLSVKSKWWILWALGFNLATDFYDSGRWWNCGEESRKGPRHIFQVLLQFWACMWWSWIWVSYEAEAWEGKRFQFWMEQWNSRGSGTTHLE